MRNPPTGEPCAGEPHARFGGRGGATLPDPYHMEKLPVIKRNQIIADTTWLYAVYRTFKSGVKL